MNDPGRGRERSIQVPREMRKVLLIDDDPNDVELALAAFAKFGIADDVLVARDGEEGISMLRRQGPFADMVGMNPALVVLDLKMPRVTGSEVLEVLRGDEALSVVPVVVLTTSRDKNDVAKCYRLGASAYIVKPVDYCKFVDTIQRIVHFWLGCNEPPFGCIRPSVSDPQGRIGSTKR